MAAVVTWTTDLEAGRSSRRCATAEVDRRDASWIHVVPPRSGGAAGGGFTAAAAAVPPQMRLAASTYRRRQAVAAGLVVALVLVVWAALGMLGGGPLPASEHPSGAGAARPGATYVVQPGDTLWSIARRLRPNADPRPIVDQLAAANHGSTIYVGERLPLPAAS